MSGRKKHQRKIKQIIISVGDSKEVFELNSKEEFKLKKEVIIHRTQKMWKKIKEYERNIQSKQANAQQELPKKDEKCELKKELFDDLFRNDLNDDVDYFDLEIQEKGSMMHDFNKINHIFYLKLFF